jgi:6-phosphofructokinase 1
MAKIVGVLTSGGDNPGLNAALRGLGKAAIGQYDMHVVGFKDGFRGLMENRSLDLDGKLLSGILTLGGTILGTSRDKPHKMLVGGKELDMTEVIVENYYKNHLDCLVCIGGNGTQKNAYHLMKRGLNVITLPKTIDNDVVLTDATFGFDTAMGVAVDAIDRLHSTAHSHHRIIIVEIMGHKAGWLTLGAGVAGGADVILIPEIPYNIEAVANSILNRSKEGKHFSIVAIAEGAMSKEFADQYESLCAKIEKEDEKEKKKRLKLEKIDFEHIRTSNTMRLANKLHDLTGLDARVTILGHLQRGGTPSAADRLLATRLGTAAADLIHKGKFGYMVAARGDGAEAVPLEKVAGKLRTVPVEHNWIHSARMVGTCLGDL